MQLTGPDDQIIIINEDEITSMRSPRGTDHMHPDIKCMIYTSDTKIVAVIQTCQEVRKMLVDEK